MKKNTNSISNLFFTFLIYFCLFVFINLIPYFSSTDNKIKIILFFSTIIIFLFFVNYYGNTFLLDKYKNIKKYSNLNIACLLIGMTLFLYLGHAIFKKSESLVPLYVVFSILLLISFFSQYKLSVLKKQLGGDTNLFIKFDKILDKKQLMDASNKVDNLQLVFIFSLSFVDNIYLFTIIVGGILILSIKYLKVIKGEFLSSGLISSKETTLTLIIYYFCYGLSVVSYIFIPKMLVFLIGMLSTLALKIFMRRVAIGVYTERK